MYIDRKINGVAIKIREKNARIHQRRELPPLFPSAKHNAYLYNFISQDNVQQHNGVSWIGMKQLLCSNVFFFQRDATTTSG